jgi:hypothetical protein
MSTATILPASSLPPHVPAPAVVTSGIVINGQVRLPANLTDLDAFRRWARSEDCPEKGHFGFLNGILWVDLSMEQYHTHNQVKNEFNRSLGNLVRDLGTGRYLCDGMLLTIPGVSLSTIPDGLFHTYAARHSGRVRLIPNARNVGGIELEGVPEMVLEVVSDSSVEKDNITLPGLYLAAGIEEFWRADARGELSFEIFYLTNGNYVCTRQPDGWCRSPLFGRDFQLTQATDPLGEPLFTLQVRG